MNLTSHVSSSSHQQHLNVKEEIDADSVEWTIKVEGEMVPVKLEIKTEDEEKPTVCQCEECGSGGRRKMARCTRAWSLSQAIKKEELKGDDEQSGEARRDKQTEILVKKEVKKEEDELNVAGSSTQRCGSASVDSVIIKFEDEEVTCPCEECGMVKTEEEDEEVKEEVEAVSEVVPGHRVKGEVAVEGGGNGDEETVVEGGSEDEEDWLASTGSSLGSSSEEGEEETEDGSAELAHEPNETVSSTAPLEVRPVAGADIEPARTAKGCKRRPCPQCQKMVTNLTIHRLTHTKERSHICDQCGKSFAQKSTLNNHLKIHSGEKAFSCDQCSRSFTLKANLNVHLKIHSGEKAFSCQHCGKCFTQKSVLKRHLKAHTGEKAFSCDHCGKSFTQKHSLTVHLKRHSGEKAHQCDQCPSTFVTSTELTNHRRQKHTGQRPYTCHIANCDKAFACQSNLHKHLRYHTGDKKHHCEDCEMRFVTRGELTTHRRHKHSTERPYRCPHSSCNYAAVTKDDLKKHLNGKKHRQ